MSERHEGPVLHDAERFRVVDCRSCGFAHLDPKPSQRQVAEFYAKHFLDQAKPDYLEKVERELDYWNRVSFAGKERRLRALLGRPGRILDVGCCGGFLLRYFREQGWDVHGVEPAEQAVEWATGKYGLPVTPGFFERIPPERLGQFDAVHMAFVLEHVLDPTEILHRAHSVLRPGGAICVEVPNDFNPLQRVIVETLDKPRWWVCWPDHVNYFNFESLERTLDRCGFEVAGRDGAFPMELFVLMGDDYIGNDAVGRACHEKRMLLERNVLRGGVEDPTGLLYGGLAARGLGRQAIVYARKAA
jgi:2-polyprenyl-3-methyl-5-hydroxy-6-metoxy-1,4-benzoquinol methylase